MSNIEKIRQEIDTRRQHMVEELMGHEENCEYHRIKGMHDAYVDLLTFLDYSLPACKDSLQAQEICKENPDSFTSLKDDLVLTWEDMAKIDAIILDVNNEFAVDYSKEIDRQKFYEEVLKRFKNLKNK